MNQLVQSSFGHGVITIISDQHRSAAPLQSWSPVKPVHPAQPPACSFVKALPILSEYEAKISCLL